LESAADQAQKAQAHPASLWRCHKHRLAQADKPQRRVRKCRRHLRQTHLFPDKCQAPFQVTGRLQQQDR